MPEVALPVLVIGAGPAGLATAAELTGRRMPFRLLERGASLGSTWENLYDSLVLHTGRHMSTLPGRSYASGTPLFPSRQQFIAYLREYARAFAIAVEVERDVVALRRSPLGWCATLGDGTRVEAGSVVVATGIVANPRTPEIPGRERFRGRVLHSVDYRRPDSFLGQRVLVVGVGNSGGEIGSELARAGVNVTMLVRSGANVVPLTIAGIPIQYLSSIVRTLPRPAQEWVVQQVQRISDSKRGAPVFPRSTHSSLDAIPLIGFNLVDAIKRGIAKLKLAGLARFTADGVTFTDGSEAPFDTVIFATGFAPALSALGAQIRTDARGFALRSDRVTSSDQPGLYFVGHNYDSSGGLSNIRRDAPIAVAHIADCRVMAARMRCNREAARRSAANR